MKIIKKLGCWMLFVAMLSACSSNVKMNTDYNENTDFTAYQTYRWYSPEGDEKAKENHAENDILDARIRSNVDNQLAKKGMELKPDGKVDFYVNYSVTAVDEVNVEKYNTYSGYSRNYRWYGGGYGYGYRGGYHRGGVTMTMTGIPEQVTEIDEYKKGTLLIDIIEPVEDTLVWRGAANGRLPEKKVSAEKRDAAVQEIVGGLMSNFPP